jgi:tetratricopeptide (TPR) repeat protein
LGQDAVDYYNLGIESSSANKKIYYFTIALELNQDLSVAYEKRGMLHYFKGEYNETIQDFRKVVELKPLEPQAHEMLGLAYLRNENYEDAIVHLSRAIELNPELGSAYGYRAEAFLLKGMATEAVQDSARAIQIGGSEQTVGRAYTIRERAYRELGRTEPANADLQKALRLDPQYYIYTVTSPTELLGDWASESSKLERVGLVGIVGAVAVVIVVVFKLVLVAPNKHDHS